MKLVQPRKGQKITDSQRRAIFGLAKRNGLDDETIRSAVEAVTGRTVDFQHTGISDLSFSEANGVMVKLGGVPFASRELHRQRAKAEIKRAVRKGGNPDIKSQLDLIAELASQREQMRGKPEALKAFCKRCIKKDAPTTTTEATIIIEALKAMNRREGLWAA
jgi:hypothetical protein